jgi:membrane protease YdiL (CAAX protease family)
MSLRCVERSMFSKLTQSPTLVRVAPFAVFIGLMLFQDRFGESGRYWIYLAKTLAAAAMLLVVVRHVEELEWRFSWEAVVVGVAVFALWIGLDGRYPPLNALYANHLCPLLQKLGLAKDCSLSIAPPWNPNEAFGIRSPLAVFFIVVRIAGSSLVVPMLEEVFFRSFVYRFLASKDWLAVPLGKFQLMPFVVASLVFGVEHHQWLAGILCAFAYQGLVIWKGRLGDAVTAHAITNFLLGVWVVWRGAWQFW